MRFRITRLDRERFAVILEGLVIAPQRSKRAAASVERFRVFRLQFERLIETCESFAMPVESVENNAMIEQHLRRVRPGAQCRRNQAKGRSEEHTTELQSRGLISYAVFCLKKK